MDLQKVKEALMAARNQMENDIISIDNDADIFEMIQQNEMPEAWGMVVEAIAELEKPTVEDAKRVAVLAWRSNEHPGGFDWIDTAGAIIQQYAESYHARMMQNVGKGE